ncbi:MAG: lasso peptide biosynthesis B2 protein [Methylobacter sp.]|nr:lasso peptide biosynthesis B2 protein [Methylobacter sp.]
MSLPDSRTFTPATIFSTLVRKVRRFAHRPWFEKIWFLPVWLLLGISRFVILTIPFRHLALRLGAHEGIAPWVPLVDARAEARALSISRVVRMAANYTPWKSNCFPQALTARILLGLYGVPYSLFFGVNRNTEDVTLAAHAWVAAGRVRVTGGMSFNQFTVVGCFVSARLLTMSRQSSE